MNKKEQYRHGGSDTPQYYCPLCKRSHTIHSELGKKHLKHRRKH